MQFVESIPVIQAAIEDLSPTIPKLKENSPFHRCRAEEGDRGVDSYADEAVLTVDSAF